LLKIQRFITVLFILLVAIGALWLNCGNNNSASDDCHIFAIVISGEGTVNYEPELSCYQTGDQVFISALAADGWVFYKWTGNVTFADSTEYDNHIIVTFENENIALVANFREELLLTINIEPLFGGTVEADPDNYYYIYGDSVTLEAIPSTGYAFAHWVYNDLEYDTNPIVIAFNFGDKEITAVFDEIE